MKPPAVLSVLALWSAVAALPVIASEPFQPFLLDVDALDAAVVLPQAREARSAPILTVTDKPQPSPSGDLHDYVSYGRYWWPNPASSNGLPYIRKDGHSNLKQLALGDRHKVGQLTTIVHQLASAWHLRRETNCALRAGEWLRAWFVAPDTRMNPSLEYAQIRLGHNANRGSSFGVIDTRAFAGLIDSIRMLQDSPALADPEVDAVRQWFGDYLQWLTTSKKGRLERAAPNNHGTWYLVQALAIARFLGNDEQAREFAQEDFARIARQFESDGRQPLELARADGLSYSVFNLDAQFKVAKLAAPLGIDLWHYTATNGASLRQGLEFLRPYNLAPQTWPHRQLKTLKPGFLQPLLDQGARIWPEESSR